jgi:hypothetical protein
MIRERILIMQEAAAATGNGTPFMCEGVAFLACQVSGTFVGTVTFEATIDDTNWIAIQAKNENNGSLSSTATSTGIYSFPVAGYLKARARVSTWTSGTITVTGKGTALSPGVSLADVELSAASVNIGDVDILSLPSVASSTKVSPVGGAKSVTTSGTGEALVASSTDAQMLFVEAKSGNTGAIYFGDSAVDKTTSKQVTLLQGQSVDVHADGGYKLDINEFYIDADNNGDGVDFLYI